MGFILSENVCLVLYLPSLICYESASKIIEQKKILKCFLRNIRKSLFEPQTCQRLHLGLEKGMEFGGVQKSVLLKAFYVQHFIFDHFTEFFLDFLCPTFLIILPQDTWLQRSINCYVVDLLHLFCTFELKMLIQTKLNI